MKNSNTILTVLTLLVILLAYYMIRSSPPTNKNAGFAQIVTESDPGSFVRADSIDGLIKKFVSDQHGEIETQTAPNKQLYKLVSIPADKLLGPEQGYKQLLATWGESIKIQKSGTLLSTVIFAFDLKLIAGTNYMRVPLELLFNLLSAYTINQRSN